MNTGTYDSLKELQRILDILWSVNDWPEYTDDNNYDEQHDNEGDGR